MLEDASLAPSTYLSAKSYDALMKGWSRQDLHDGLTLNVDSEYTRDAKEARQRIIKKHGWTIHDEGLREE
jgi:hypothetical protein